MSTLRFHPIAGRSSAEYVFSERSVSAANVALATRRPLLVVGPPGVGKTALAAGLAANLGANLYSIELRSRSRANDLLYHLDERRMQRDATYGALHVSLSAYVEPGPVWWAFDPKSAQCRGEFSKISVEQAHDPARGGGHCSEAAVVLIDEVDRADDDFLLDLVAILDDASFFVSETRFHVTARRNVLFVITSRGERALTTTFTRRCVLLALETPSRDELVQIGRTHFRHVPPDRLEALSDRFGAVWKERQAHGQPPIGVSTYLDLISAMESLAFDPVDDRSWDTFAPRILTAYGVGDPMKTAVSAAANLPRRPVGGASVFINYAREDEAIALRLYDDLLKYGFSPWLDKRKLLPGQPWKTEIEKAIRQSAFFIALLSSSSVVKRGYVQAELKVAYQVLDEIPSGHVYVIPIRIDAVEIPKGPLSELHWLELEPYEEGIRRIRDTINAVPPDRAGAWGQQVSGLAQGFEQPSGVELPFRD